MIIYTPLHEEEIFEEEENHEDFRWVSVDHATVKLKKTDEINGYEIVQMTSTNPADYLKKHLEPGSIYYL
ncbi:YlzJ-like family protein [Alkalibacillus aidingensis]|uniref:YlzJ-like family protein n=1 Tax=Alkalibacillus aidingensis TaxID=2747607 RepID=UPI0016610A3B|nr:YlzJ-like family protein [Alkalibacillus aidingensis]